GHQELSGFLDLPVVECMVVGAALLGAAKFEPGVLGPLLHVRLEIVAQPAGFLRRDDRFLDGCGVLAGAEAGSETQNRGCHENPVLRRHAALPEKVPDPFFRASARCSTARPPPRPPPPARSCSSCRSPPPAPPRRSAAPPPRPGRPPG